ncbi:primosomal protein N' [Georgenia alba]|uniref:Probable replication restart protein PriA n=1 Tax=Georgenia alba TaxID=2233858 RepID=A0ABW2Q9Q8_9MICO
MTGDPAQRPEQGTLLDLPDVAAGARRVDGRGVTDPVARVVVDSPLPHLDRPFDYLVPPEHDANAVPGARVHVRFAGQDRQAFVLERRADTEHTGTLTPVRRASSAVPVLTPEVRRLCRAVADRYAGTLMDVVRLAVPPRHATTEKSVLERHDESATPAAVEAPEPGPWEPYTGGPAFLRHLAAGERPRAVWTTLPGPTGPAVATAVQATVASGRGALVVVPTTRHVDDVVAALGEALPEEPVARLVADDGPARRYRSFLRVLLGEVRVVVGTRAAAFAPVRDLGLAVVLDDGDDRLEEPHAPYPHTRQVLVLRAELSGSALLVGGYARSVEAQLLVEQGWARPVQAPRAVVRETAPRVVAPSETDLAREGAAAAARVPRPAWELARDALGRGPVLVQVARAGYLPAVACARCREPARCAACHGPLRLEGARSAPTCGWCGRPAADWRCPECDGTRLRWVRVGSDRTAEELGRAFPSVPVVVSGARASHGVVETVDGTPRLVVATPGAEPAAEGGYAAALILDASATTGRPELWAAAEALRRWFGAAALVRSARDGGTVMLLGQPAPVPAQALVRWDPAGFAERELAERAGLAFPPAVRLAALQGPRSAVRSLLGHLGHVPGLEVLGPVETEEEQVRALVRTERANGPELTRALTRAAAVRSARKEPGAVRVRVDPTDLW